jgi:hypothetical protein
MVRLVAAFIVGCCVVAPCFTAAEDATPRADVPLVELRGREGFWRAGRDQGGAWWFVSPDGRREFLNSVTTVQPCLLGRDPKGPHYVAGAYAGSHDLDAWAEATVRRLRSFGFKGVGAWSEPVLHRFDVPITRDLNLSTWAGGAPWSGDDSAWAAAIEEAVRKQVGPLRDNHQLVGYYLDNELYWDRGDDAATYRAARRYFEVTTRAVRKYDPNHLVLGVRFRGEAPAAVVRASKGLTDAQSINYYPHDAKLDRNLFRTLHELSGGQPVIVSEYSFHALDGRSGNRNRFGFPAQVADQRARAEGYRQMTTRLARLPYVIGADWFQWMDEPPSGRLRDGEDANFGVVDVRDGAYELLVEAVRSTTPRLNALHGRSTSESYADVWRESPDKVADVGAGELVSP